MYWNGEGRRGIDALEVARGDAIPTRRRKKKLLQISGD